MSKIKNHIMDVEETVCSSLDLENIISESDTLNQAQEVVKSLLTDWTHFDRDIATHYVAECWNEYWGNQYV